MRPALLRTLTFRPRRDFEPGEEVAAAAALSSSDCFRRLQKKNARKMINATPARTPMTMPAMAPPLSAFELELAPEEFRLLLTLVGVMVTVCVTTLPEMTVVMILVAGCTGADVGVAVDENVVEGMA
jgi:hypothetical protein